MNKLLLIVIVGAIVYFIVRGHVRSIARERQVKPAAPEEDMVRCAQCGVHLPKSESVAAPGKYFCSEEHRRLHS